MERTLQERVTRELEEAIGGCETYRSVDRASGEVVVYDSERGALKIGDGTSRSWRHFYNARCRELIRSMEISDKLLCLFNAELTATDDGYVVEVPQSEIETGSLESGEIYRVALISRDAAESKSSESSRSSRPSSEPQPPVEQGETRSVEVEDLGKQGDGIARVERGYVIIVPGAGIGNRSKSRSVRSDRISRSARLSRRHRRTHVFTIKRVEQ